jgi:hypothetical protein
MKKVHRWYGEMGEDTWPKIWNTKKTIWKGLLGRKDVSHVTTVEQTQVSSNASFLRWHSLITVGFYVFPETEVSQSVHFPWPFIVFLRALYMSLITREGDIQVPSPAATLLKWWIKWSCSTQHLLISFSSIYVVQQLLLKNQPKDRINRFPSKAMCFCLFVTQR